MWTSNVRSSSRTGPLAALCLLILAVPASAQERAEAGGEIANAHILGAVAEREAKVPLGTVQVVLAREGGEEVWSGVTDTRGRFRISRIPPGTYDLTFSRLGYQTANETVTVDPQAEVTVEVQLTSEAIELEPLVVTSSRRSLLQTVGFYDREVSFDGDFFHQEDIEDREAGSIPDLVRMLPAFRVMGRPPDDYVIFSQRGGVPIVPGQEPCSPAVFLDGMPMESSPWKLVRPHHLAAMEVYSGMMTPAQFFSRGDCGAIVMWTRGGDPRPGEAEPTRRGIPRLVVGAAALAAAAGLHLLF